jgi:hypothetical protein
MPRVVASVEEVGADEQEGSALVPYDERRGRDHRTEKALIEREKAQEHPLFQSQVQELQRSCGTLLPNFNFVHTNNRWYLVVRRVSRATLGITLVDGEVELALTSVITDIEIHKLAEVIGCPTEFLKDLLKTFSETARICPPVPVGEPMAKHHMEGDPFYVLSFPLLKPSSHSSFVVSED